MKKLSNLCFAGALLLSHAMCAFVAANYVNMTWEIQYGGYSAPASTACFLAIPYGIAIVACLALGTGGWNTPQTIAFKTGQESGNARIPGQFTI